MSWLLACLLLFMFYIVQKEQYFLKNCELDNLYALQSDWVFPTSINIINKKLTAKSNDNVKIKISIF